MTDTQKTTIHVLHPKRSQTKKAKFYRFLRREKKRAEFNNQTILKASF